MPSKRNTLIVLVSFAILAWVAILYAPVLYHHFVNWDDNDYVVNNTHIHAGFSAQSIRWALTSIYAVNWHPVTWFSHMLDCQLFGPEKSGLHHLTALLIHALNSLLLFWLLVRWTGSLWRSTLVALLFATHPMHVESVAWVSERKDLLSATFGLLTVFCYLYYVNRRDVVFADDAKKINSKIPALLCYIATLIFYALGLMAKPMLVTLPFVLLLLDLWPLQRLQCDFICKNAEPPKPRHRHAWVLPLLEKIPLIACAIFSAAMTYYAQSVGGSVKPLESVPFGRRVLESFIAYAAYVHKLFSPTELSFFYPRPEHLDTLTLVIAIFLILALSAIAWFFRKKMPYGFIGWCCFLGTLVPVIGLLRVGDQFYADRYTYIPYIGLFIWIAWALGDIAKIRARWTPIFVTAMVAWLIALSVLAQRQVMVWRDDESLFGNAIALDPENGRAYGCMAEVYQRNGNSKKSFDYYQKAVQYDPHFVPSRVNFGVNLAQLGRLPEAREQLLMGLQFGPDSAAAHTNLGIVLAQLGDWPNAEKHLKKALEIDPNYPPAQANMKVFENVMKSRTKP